VVPARIDEVMLLSDFWARVDDIEAQEPQPRPLALFEISELSFEQ